MKDWLNTLISPRLVTAKVVSLTSIRRTVSESIYYVTKNKFSFNHTMPV
jgi:hypothetical protein